MFSTHECPIVSFVPTARVFTLTLPWDKTAINNNLCARRNVPRGVTTPPELQVNKLWRRRGGGGTERARIDKSFSTAGFAVTHRGRSSGSQIKRNVGGIMLTYDNVEAQFASCATERGRKSERKDTNAGRRVFKLMRIRTHTHTHTHIRDCRTPFLQSNLGGDEMGDELRWEGWRDEGRFELQNPETDCFIIHLQQYLYTHTHTHTHTHTQPCNLLSHNDILSLFHSISPVLRHTRLSGDDSPLWASCNKYDGKHEERTCEKSPKERGKHGFRNKSWVCSFEVWKEIFYIFLDAYTNKTIQTVVDLFADIFRYPFASTAIQWFQCNKWNSLLTYPTYLRSVLFGNIPPIKALLTCRRI